MNRPQAQPTPPFSGSSSIRSLSVTPPSSPRKAALLIESASLVVVDVQHRRILSELLPKYEELSEKGGHGAASFATATAVRMLLGFFMSRDECSWILPIRQLLENIEKLSPMDATSQHIQLVKYILGKVQSLANDRSAYTWAAQVFQSLDSYLVQALRPVEYEGAHASKVRAAPADQLIL